MQNMGCTNHENVLFYMLKSDLGSIAPDKLKREKQLQTQKYSFNKETDYILLKGFTRSLLTKVEITVVFLQITQNYKTRKELRGVEV